MKKIIFILFATLLFAFENQPTNNENGIIIYNLPEIKNNTQPENMENNNTINSPTYEEVFQGNIKAKKPKIDLAIVIDKNRLKKYIPSIINSITSYLLYKKSEFNLSVYDINEIDKALKHKNILFYTYDTNNLYYYTQYSNNFYFPMINKNDVTIENSNFYFGGIDYKSQIQKLSKLIENNYTIAINEDTLTSQKIYSIESDFFNVFSYNYKHINYRKLKNNYVFLNTSPQKSIQILSNIYYKNIEPLLILSTQINYSPILIAFSQNEALNKVIIANSIINPPKELADIHMLLNSDIKFNWLNYSANILCNKIYNLYSNGDIYLMNDFMVYIYNNQINFNTELYQIVFKAFKKISTP